MDTDILQKPFMATYIYVMLIKETKVMKFAINFIAYRSMWFGQGAVFYL